MRTKLASMGAIALLAVALSACGGKQADTTQGSGAPAQPAATAPVAAPASNEPRTIKYLDKEYKVPAKVENIVITGALEAMEDAIVLDVKPKGAISVGGKFPPMFAAITGQSQSIGEKTQPNLETIVKLKPDVILGTSKFPAETAEKLTKIATTFPVSHISTHWEANLRLLGELTGKQAKAEEVLKQYKADTEAAKKQLGEKLKDKKVVAIRVRSGNIAIYPADVFFNPSLYTDLGLAVPEEVKAAKAQETVSVEKFAQMNPDYLFIQFSEDENTDKPTALQDLQNNPIIKSTNAFKNGKVFVNVVDPLAQGGTAWSKISFLKAAVANLSK
ncbi:MAG: iron-uptake system-binding protein [Paenibacillus sp.]|nr:iron-uptake system-binding protein [Paenibacillus sp.]